MCSITCLPDHEDCNANISDGCEIDTQNGDVDNCSGCGLACSKNNIAASCANGSCEGGVCNIGFEDCNGLKRFDGCEADLLTGTVGGSPTITNCGTCGNTCPNLVGAQCINGLCTGSCPVGTADCTNPSPVNCNVDTNNDANNCGGCGIKCSGMNVMNSMCVGGVCMGSCAPGFADCNSNLQADGCEINIKTDTGNCGTCGTICNTQNTSSVACNNGGCVPSCSPGFADCNNNDVTDGCEINLKTDNNNCNVCGTMCTAANGSATCNNGTCTVASCTPPFQDCDTQYNTGCEANLDTAQKNCGGCGNDCTKGQHLQNAGATTCAGGICQISCAAGFDTCDGDALNGCETAITTVTNCGACGIVCSTQNDNNVKCMNNVCQATCNGGFGDCNNNIQLDGCEVNLKTDPMNCNMCGTVCTASNATTVCNNGSCAVGSCTAPFANCDNQYNNGCEADLTTTQKNCGGCGNDCTKGQHLQNANATPCVGSLCQPTCAAGFGDCDGDPLNGCETALNTITNCGMCGHTCSQNNGVEACMGGSCVVQSCSAGFANCNNDASDGCETNTSNDPMNCGGCSAMNPTFACSTQHIAPACTNGICTGTCAFGYADCDANPRTNGCEATIQVNPMACNTCPSGMPTMCPMAQVCAVGNNMDSCVMPPPPCFAGTDPVTSGTYVVCGMSTAQAIELSTTGPGPYALGDICRQLGYNTVSAYGPNGGNLCSDSMDTMSRTCGAPNTMPVLSNSGGGMDAFGPLVVGSYTWTCSNP
jgi:hypothetical protein